TAAPPDLPAATSPVDHPERNQPAALRDAQGDHGGEEKGDQEGGRRAGLVADAQDCKRVFSGEGKEDADDLRERRRCREGSGEAPARGSESAVILVVAEHRDGALNRATWETIAAAQQAGTLVKLVVLGAGIDALPAVV